MNIAAPKLASTAINPSEPRGMRYVNEADPVFNSLAYFLRNKAQFDYEETKNFYRLFEESRPSLNAKAWMGCNDRFWLLINLLNRPDADHPWIFDRCREVEADPDNHLDLWARYHYKSTIITFAGNIQDILCDPEITIAIFSVSLKIAVPFLEQIKGEFEGNEELKEVYPDVLYLDPKKESDCWSVDKGILVKRKSNPKEKTVEAHGLIDAMPTGRHFQKLCYDDVVTEKHVDNPDVVIKVTQRVELSDNLGIGEKTRRQFIGTRYSFADTYGVILERGQLVPRIYPATDDGRADGNPVFISKEEWESIKVKQHSTYAAQMLQNPAAGEEASFDIRWLQQYWIRPRHINVYILVDPSMGRGQAKKKSDNTAMAVVGIDTLNNKYLLDGFCHRMDLRTRWENLKRLYRKWSKARGVHLCKVGYERYGMQSDIEYFEERMLIEGSPFAIEEVNWTGDSVQSKKVRVERLQAPFKGGEFYFPALIYHEQANGPCTWGMPEDEYKVQYTAHRRGAINSEMERAINTHNTDLIVKPIKRMDESKRIYDVTRHCLEEIMHFPFSERDDFVDALNRYIDLKPIKCDPFEDERVLEPLDD